MRLALKEKNRVCEEVAISQSRKAPLEIVNRLTREEQIKVVQWLVELKSAGQISELIKNEFKKDISRQNVWKYSASRKWRPIVERLRKRFERNICKLPIANKAHRLRLLQKVVDEGLTWSLKNITKDGDEVYELKLGAVTEAIKAAREELEPHQKGAIIIGDGAKIIFQDIKIEQAPAGELLKDINNRLSLQFTK